MATSTWQQILQRGQQSLAVWLQHSPAFTVRGLTRAQHLTDVTALSPKAQEVEDDQQVVDDARAARDAGQAVVVSMNTRMPRRLDGELPIDDPFHADLEDIRTVSSDTPAHLQERGQKVVALWKKLNARNAAAVPMLPPLVVGGVTLAIFQAQVEGLPALQQTVEDKEAVLRERRGELRKLALKVDANNKRWYAAWQGEFPAGTPEGDALSQVDTESGGSGEGGPGEPPAPTPPPPEPPALPGQATLAALNTNGTEVMLTGMAADGAVTFVVEFQANGNGYTVMGDAIIGSDFTFTAPSTGNCEVRVAGQNAAGTGPWSGPASFTLS